MIPLSPGQPAPPITMTLIRHARQAVIGLISGAHIWSAPHDKQCSPLAPPVPRRARDTVMGGRSGALMALPRFLFSAEVLGWEAREDETNSSPGLPS